MNSKYCSYVFLAALILLILACGGNTFINSDYNPPTNNDLTLLIIPYFENTPVNVNSIFEDFFGFSSGSRSRSRVQKGADLRFDMTLSFMDAAFGTETEIDVQKMETCSSCEGNKCEPDTHPETCRQCNGTGQVSRNQGFFTVRSTCYQCNGNGQTIPHPCAMQ